MSPNLTRRIAKIMSIGYGPAGVPPMVTASKVIAEVLADPEVAEALRMKREHEQRSEG